MPDDRHPHPPSYDAAVEDHNKKSINVTTRSRRSSSESTNAPSLRIPRTPRFAEATAVHSPIEPSQQGRSPFADPSRRMATNTTDNTDRASVQPSDVGFGYIAGPRTPRFGITSTATGPEESNEYPKSPLKSAMKTPGTPGRKFENPLSPTFNEEQVLEKHEGETEKQQAKDLKVKTRVRMAKMVLRGVNFSCSLIVLSMIGSTFSIINATRHLPPRNNLPAWAAGGPIWPQITLLCIACVSLFLSIVIFWAYFRTGHRRAEKVAVYYTVFAVAFFVFSIIMWAVGAGILNQSKKNNAGQDIWGWSCNDNTRKQLFQSEVNYDLVCRFQDWSLVCCIIEVVVETITIAIYAIVFYRFYSKRKLHKSMDLRDKARSDMYLAQLRSQSAPNTPGFGGPMSPRFKSESNDPYSQAEEGGASASDGTSLQYATPSTAHSSPKPFQLQPPPIRIQHATPRPGQEGFDSAPSSPTLAPAPVHVPAAPGEQQYASVPIPGAYNTPMQSPTFNSHIQPQSMTQADHIAPGQAFTSEHRVESPPGSPRGFR